MNINNLPLEILETIFLYLPLADRKNASRVCHRWHDAVFSWPCLETVVLRLLYAPHLHLGAFARVLENSKRKYRNIRIRFGGLPLDDYQLECIARVLRKFADSFEQLRFVWNVYEDPFSLKLLCHCLELLPKLKELSVENHGMQKVDSNPVEVKPIDTLTKITLPNSLLFCPRFDVIALAPQARHIDVSFSGSPWKAIQSLSGQLLSFRFLEKQQGTCFHWLSEIKMPKLQKLWFSKRGNFYLNQVELKDACRFLYQFKGLTELHFKIHLPLSVIETIVKNCTRLKKFTIHCESGWPVLTILQRLEVLAYVKLIDCDFTDNCNSVSKISLPALRRLSLERYGLKNSKQFFICLDQIAPKLQVLELNGYTWLNDSESYDDTVESLFNSKLRSLQRLDLSNASAIFPSYVLNHIDQLPRLTELKLTWTNLTPLELTTTISRVKRLTLEIPLYTQQLRELILAFPSLVLLELIHKGETINFFGEQLWNAVADNQMRKFRPYCRVNLEDFDD